ncbi:IclR family transcriptional regulator [Variovorax sp. OV329]|uniref:IclR family transcriptional regulator n=1 Tax=Variovorax sp. OV329 TaxID=1882825 RepID=UPI0008E51760|nr:IclR family transcriptional regulator [Variovorax sp. OV329]SFL88288.1 transcriptional regulator, IclR family [Variovorax sp. OV329]
MSDNDITEEGADRYNVPALERGLRVLCEFSREHRTLSAPELARRFDLPRSTVFRLLSTLENMGFLEKAEGGRDYRLGLAVLRLGFEYLASLELTQLGTPLLQRLSEELHTSCNLVVRDGRSIVYVAKVAQATPFTSSVSVGTRLPAHATVLGRILLEDLTLPQLRALYPEDHLETFSPSTPKTVTELFDMVQADRQRGYVLGEGFFESNISSIAAPVRDHSGHIVAALGATIPSGHIDEGRIDEMVTRVRATADDISGLLNYAPAASSKVVPMRRA